MKTITYTILWLCVIQCAAFANVQSSTSASILNPKKDLNVNPAARQSAWLRLSGADHSEAARALFGNIIGPAAMLAGGLVPLGFLAEPLPDNTPLRKKMSCLYYFLSVASLVNQLLAIMYATVACNKLLEIPVASAPSVFALILRDYELPWIGTNVHFIFGLLGFVAMILIRAFALFPPSVNKSAAGLGGAALLAMLSVVNVGVSEGDGRGQQFGGNILSLVVRYGVLVVNQIFTKGGYIAFASFVLAVMSTVTAASNLLSLEKYKD
jgi:hypothetical protein